MQLLRDNLTLWTSSDGNEGEAAPAEAKTAEGDKPAETAQQPAAAETTEAKTEEPAAAPAAAS